MSDGGSAWECGCNDPTAHAGSILPKPGMVRTVEEDGHVRWATPPGPVIVGTISVGSNDGYSRLQYKPTDGYREPITLYAWSDGVVTWKEERDV